MSESEIAMRPSRPPLPKPLQWILRVTGAFAMILFLTPTVYVLKYCFWDSPRESRIADRWRTEPNDAALARRLAPADPDNVSLASQTALKHPNAKLRLTAVQSLGNILAAPGVSYRRPLESVTAKATLGQVAVHDADLAVRAAASEILGKIAKNGAVLRR